MSPDLPSSESRFTALKAVRFLILLVSAVFLALHALHLNADFPNHSPWMDWSKYTDEGWYGDAAIRHFQRGHWYVPGDFNPAAALPVWPLLESIVFRFTGVCNVAARALTVTIFGFILIASYLLLRRWMSGSARGQSLAPAIAVLLLAVSPFCYVFTRMAILEPMLILLTLLALLVASYVTPQPEQGSARPPKHPLLPARWVLLPALLGFIIPLMVLTKTTAVFLLPAIAWLLWARAGYSLRPFLRLCIPTAAVAALTWLGYYLAIVRPHFLLDYKYLFSANAYTGITVDTALSVISDTFTDGLWIGRLLYPLAILATVIALLKFRRTFQNPLVPALLLWTAGYLAFLAYHNNLQPRYYLVVAVPLTLLVPIVFEDIWRSRPHPAAHHTQTHTLASAALVAALLVTILLDARQTLRYVRTPEYTFAHAATQIHQIIEDDLRKDPTHNPLVLSISGSDLSLMTGLPSICDDFGTMDLSVRVKAYRPGWYVTWNQVDDDKMDALSPLYQLQRVAAFPAMDDPERNLLILYRLDPATPGTHPKPHHRKPIPRLLQTSLGQQPSTIQLQH
jgi:hypothetical protein